MKELWFHIPVDDNDTLFMYNKATATNGLLSDNSSLQSFALFDTAVIEVPLGLVDDGVFVHHLPLEESSTSSNDAIEGLTWNADRDELIVELDESELWRYEDQLVTFDIPNMALLDQAGNHVASNASSRCSWT